MSFHLRLLSVRKGGGSGEAGPSQHRIRLCPSTEKWKDFPSMRDVYLLKCYGKISHRKVGGVPNAIPLYLGSQKEWKPPHDLLKGK